jgi:hypothetical protein
MKTWRSGAVAPPFLTTTLDAGVLSASRPDRFTPGEEPPVPIGKEAGRAPEPVWKILSHVSVTKDGVRIGNWIY